MRVDQCARVRSVGKKGSLPLATSLSPTCLPLSKWPMEAHRVPVKRPRTPGRIDGHNLWVHRGMRTWGFLFRIGSEFQGSHSRVSHQAQAPLGTGCKPVKPALSPGWFSESVSSCSVGLGPDSLSCNLDLKLPQSVGFNSIGVGGNWGKVATEKPQHFSSLNLRGLVSCKPCCLAAAQLSWLSTIQRNTVRHWVLEPRAEQSPSSCPRASLSFCPS